ncbi:amidohydrolase family protein [Herbidospora mongoliensis]|uniref:amidohydrolase family protein n=1 Tax=Herbidospora mongoliensis TaxID=688067 RepID=UPI000830AECD|nr:amidohydrolase family protein [Herbidospora mongoliensis]
MIDAHHHLWDPSRRDYPWMSGAALSPIRRTFGLPELRATGATGTVLVQTVSSVEETREFLRTALESDGLIKGVVGWVDLTAPDVADVLAELREGPGGHLLVGIRHQVQDEPDDAWLARPDVMRGLRAVASAGLAYDLLVLVHQLGVARKVVADLPDARFVLDHAAKPPVASGLMEPWATQIEALSELENVACKISGLVTEASWTDWTPGQLQPYVEHVLEYFGPERVMFGSDWPVCLLAATYGEVVETTKDFTSGLSGDEQSYIYESTAQKVYRLKP